MSNFIFYSGLVALSLLSLTALLKTLKKKHRWHKYLGYSAFTVAFVHGGIAVYKAIRLYILYS